MRRMKGRDANMRFLFGSVFFFFIIMVVIVLFGYLALRQSLKGEGRSSDCYRIAFSMQFEGRGYDLYLNDSLLYEGNPVSSDSVVCVSRFAQENSLLVVDRESGVVSIHEIGRRGCLLIRFGENGDIEVDVTE